MTGWRRNLAIAVAAVAGLFVAAALTTAASSLSGQTVGLSSEPPTAGRNLAPATTPAESATPRPTTRPKRTATPRPKRTSTPRPAATSTAVPTAVPTVDDDNSGHGGGDDDSSGRGRGRGRGRGGGDDD
jgi:hypothetical protein